MRACVFVCLCVCAPNQGGWASTLHRLCSAAATRSHTKGSFVCSAQHCYRSFLIWQRFKQHRHRFRRRLVVFVVAKAICVWCVRSFVCQKRFRFVYIFFSASFTSLSLSRSFFCSKILILSSILSLYYWAQKSDLIATKFLSFLSEKNIQNLHLNQWFQLIFFTLFCLFVVLKCIFHRKVCGFSETIAEKSFCILCAGGSRNQWIF